MSRKSVKTVTSSYVIGGTGGTGLGSAIGSGSRAQYGSGSGYNFSSSSGAQFGGGGSVLGVGGGMSGRYSQSAIIQSRRPMSFASSARYGGSSGLGSGGIIMGGGGGGGFPGMGATISNVQVNPTLLAPLKLDFDTSIHGIRTQEKEQIKNLNNRFANFIDQVSDASRFLKMQLSNCTWPTKSTSEVYFYHFTQKTFPVMHRTIWKSLIIKYYVATKLTDMDIEGKAHYVLQCTPQVSRSSQTRSYGSVHLCGGSLASCFCDQSGRQRLSRRIQWRAAHCVRG